MCYKWKMLVNM